MKYRVVIGGVDVGVIAEQDINSDSIRQVITTLNQMRTAAAQQDRVSPIGLVMKVNQLNIQVDRVET